jgi:hypothetical protein
MVTFLVLLALVDVYVVGEFGWENVPAELLWLILPMSAFGTLAGYAAVSKVWDILYDGSAPSFGLAVEAVFFLVGQMLVPLAWASQYAGSGKEIVLGWAFTEFALAVINRYSARVPRVGR